MDKILVVNKEVGYTSRDIVNIVSKALNTKKVGHFGTLDPLASGVLVLGIGGYTKLCNDKMFDVKEYVVEVKLGVMTDTYDITGKVIETSNVSNFDIVEFKKVLSSYVKTYMQEVPIYSAVKVKGKKLYEYAREGIAVSLPVKEVTIYEAEFLEFVDDLIRFRVLVSKGTYIRSLINDIAKTMNCAMTMNNLVRTKQGPFDLKNANSLEDIKHGKFCFLDIWDVCSITEKELSSKEEKDILNGVAKKIDYSDCPLVLWKKNGKNVVLYRNDDCVGLSKVYFYFGGNDEF